jgi:hypothetical protein
MKMLFAILIAFSLGFLAHMYFFGMSDVNTIDLKEVAAAARDKIQYNDVIEVANPKNVTIEYDGSKFIPSNAKIETGRYLMILNTSTNKNQMWIESDYKELNTVRGYSRMEAVNIRADKPGKYYILNKLNVNAKATITVESAGK